MSAFQRIASYATVFILFCTAISTTSSLYGQAPEGVNYQAVARNNSGDLLANQIISVRFSVVANSTSGAVLYQEDHSTISTNDFGLFNLIIGQGSRTGGSLANFSAIDWSTGSKFLRVQVDAGSGFENLGTTQMLSVPYALYAKTSGSSSTSLKGGTGIIIRNDSIINDGDISETNELITAFSLEAGNILRITEAATNYDVDLTPIIPTSTDNQSLSFSSNGDSILIENGNGISIQFITDTIANFRSRISNNASNISINTTAIIDSAQNIRLSLADSSSTLRSLIGNGSDDQNLSFNQTGDSILIENGDGLNIRFIIDTIANYDARIIDNKTAAEANTTDIAGNTQAIADSTLNTRGLLADSTAELRNLIATGSDDQNLSFNQTGDSILIENGDGLNIQFITDTIANYDARIIANKTASETNASDLITNQNEIGFLKTDVANLETSFSTDSILTLQNQDSIAILTTLLGGDNDADSTNELIDSIRIVNNILEIYQQGITNTVSFDTLYNSRRLNLFNRTIANRDSINAVVAIINGITNNDNDSANEIQQLSLIADQLRIDDPSGLINPAPIDLSIYNTADNLGNHQLDSNLRLGSFYVSGDGDDEGLLIDGAGSGTFSSGLRLNSDQVTTGYPLSIRAASSRVLEITDAVTNAVEWDLNFVAGNLEFNETGVGAPLTLASGNRVGIATTTPDSALTVNGGIKSTFFTLTDGATDGSVLTSDANGVATWQTQSGIGSGNMGELTFFTADDSLRSSPALFWDEANERLGIGMNTPASRLCIWDTLSANEVTLNLRSYADNFFSGNNIYSINSYIDSEPFVFIDTAFGLNTKVTGSSDYKFGVRSYVYGGPTFLEYYALYGVADGSQEAYGLYTKAINGVTENWSAYLDTGDVYIEDTLVLNRTFKLGTGAGTGNVLTSDANGVATWQAASSGGVFEKVGGVIRDTTADYSSDFVIGSPQLADDADATHDNRLFFDKSKGAFRAGRTENAQWDDASVGAYSNAFGQNNTASEVYSTVSGGYSSIASGAYSTIGGGYANTASGNRSIIGGGVDNIASGDSSVVAGGNINIASGDLSTVGGGDRNIASGDESFVGGGTRNSATATWSTVSGGAINSARGGGAFVGGGGTNIAGGVYSSILGGSGNRAQSVYEVIVGSFNDTLLPGFSPLIFNSTDRLFVIGNGTADNARSNALVMLKNGNTTLNGVLTLSDGSNPFTLPNADGTAGQILQTDGSGAVTWTSLNAATSCPTGMTNVQGNICMDTDERAVSNWFDAAQTCTSLGYKLPTWAEWYGAAANAALTNETNNWEWVSDGTSNTARKVGNTSLTNTANDDPNTGSANFRCIYYR